jgi:hypothetical protein
VANNLGFPQVNARFSTVVLDDLARRIRTAHRKIQAAIANGLALALVIGDALIEAKARVTTGWEDWVAQNCGFGGSTARLYMQLAAHRAEIEANGASSVRAARALISKSKATKTDAAEVGGAEVVIVATADPAAIAGHLDRPRLGQRVGDLGRRAVPADLPCWLALSACRAGAGAAHQADQEREARFPQYQDQELQTRPADSGAADGAVDGDEALNFGRPGPTPARRRSHGRCCFCQRKAPDQPTWM